MKNFPPIPVEYQHIPVWPSYFIRVTSLPGYHGSYSTKIEVSSIFLSPDRELATLVRESAMFEDIGIRSHAANIGAVVEKFNATTTDMQLKFVWPVEWCPEFENYPDPPLYFTPYFKLMTHEPLHVR